MPSDICWTIEAVMVERLELGAVSLYVFIWDLFLIRCSGEIALAGPRGAERSKEVES